MRLHGIRTAGSAFGCKCAIVVVRHLPRPPHCAASAALVLACPTHVGGAPTAAVPQALCAQAPVLHKRALACFEVHLPNLAHLLVRLPALAHLLAMARRIGFLALDTSSPKSLAWLASWMCMSCLAREGTTCLATLDVVAMTTDLEATANLSSCKTRTNCNAASPVLLTTLPGGDCVRCARSSTHCALVVDGRRSCDFCRMSQSASLAAWLSRAHPAATPLLMTIPSLKPLHPAVRKRTPASVSSAKPNKTGECASSIQLVPPETKETESKKKFHIK